MFGALNRFIGRLDGEPGQQPRNGPSDNAFGFQIIRNKDPELPLEPWFDFIVGINGHTIVRSQLYSYYPANIVANQISTGRPRPNSLCDGGPQLRRIKFDPGNLECKGTFTP